MSCDTESHAIFSQTVIDKSTYKRMSKKYQTNPIYSIFCSWFVVALPSSGSSKDRHGMMHTAEIK